VEVSKSLSGDGLRYSQRQRNNWLLGRLCHRLGRLVHGRLRHRPGWLRLRLAGCAFVWALCGISMADWWWSAWLHRWVSEVHAWVTFHLLRGTMHDYAARCPVHWWWPGRRGRRRAMINKVCCGASWGESCVEFIVASLDLTLDHCHASSLKYWCNIQFDLVMKMFGWWPTYLKTYLRFKKFLSN
jgi:hypothetical protein